MPRSEKTLIETMIQEFPSGLVIEAPLTSGAYCELQPHPDTEKFDSYTKSGNICLLIHMKGSSDIAELYLTNESSPDSPNIDFFYEMASSKVLKEIMKTEGDTLVDFLSKVTNMSEGNVHVILNDEIVWPTKSFPPHVLSLDGEYTEEMKGIPPQVQKFIDSGKKMSISDIQDVSFNAGDTLTSAPREFFNDCKDVFTRYAESHGAKGREAEIYGACMTVIMTRMNTSLSSDVVNPFPELLGVPDAMRPGTPDAATIEDYLAVSRFCQSDIFTVMFNNHELESIDYTMDSATSALACMLNLKHASKDNDNVLSFISMLGEHECLRTRNSKIVRPDVGEFSDGDWCAMQKMEVLRRFHDIGNWGISFEDKMRRAVCSSMVAEYSPALSKAMMKNEQTRLLDATLARLAGVSELYPTLSAPELYTKVREEASNLDAKIHSLYAPEAPRREVQATPGLEG